VWESVGGYDETMPWMGWEDWDFWLRVAGRGWGFTHTTAITFDYRVRRGSMLEVTNQHVPELLAHIFGKPENRAARDLRALSLEVDQLREKVRFLEESRDYRLGSGILDPIRAVVRLMAPRRTGR
jgi:hypothetical protein